jgi:hypothetical protein
MGSRQKPERRSAISIFHLSFFICHFRSSLLINNKWKMENDNWKMHPQPRASDF